jgi:hypothetical protein
MTLGLCAVAWLGTAGIVAHAAERPEFRDGLRAAEATLTASAAAH